MTTARHPVAGAPKQHPHATGGPGRLDFSQSPVVAFWETTRACALKCRHCRAEAQPLRHPLELTTEEGFRLLDDLASFDPAPIAILSGGDPFMRRDIFDLLEYGKDRGLRVSLSPSVTKLVKRDVLIRLVDMGMSRTSFSLDGSCPEIHDEFRGMRRSFEQTMALIEEALDVGLSLQINTTVTRHNLHDLPRMAELLSRHPRIVLWDLFFLVPTGRGQRDEVISPAEHEETFHWLIDLAETVPFGVKTTLGQHHRRVTLQRAEQDGKDVAQVRAALARTSSNDGKGVCFVSHVGEIFPSGFLPLDRGNVRRDSVVKVYRNDPVFRELRDPDKLQGKCGRCPFNTVCGGSRARAYAYHGNYMATEPCCIYDPDTGEVPGRLSS